MRIKLTKSAIDAIKTPAKGRAVLIDTATPGLALIITRNDSRVFYAVRWSAGKVRWIRLGALAEMTVDDAKRKAREVNSALADGVDPNAQKRQARNAVTLGDVWTSYRAAVAKAPRTMAEDAGLWTRYLEPWGGKRLADITSAQVQRLYNRISAGEMDRESLDRFGHKRPIKGGASAARHTVKLLREIFNAMAKTFGLVDNPAKGIRQKKEASCDRYLTPDEFPAFWSALEAQDELLRDALKLALFTGQRRANLLAMQWEHVNLNFKTWTIPASEMKSRRPHTVPLPMQAMAILERRRQTNPTGQWVLANPESSTGYLRNPESAIERIWKSAEIPPFSLHDLRRSTATWLNATGASEATTAAILAHAHRNVTGVYMKATADNMRQSLQAAADAMEKAAGVAPATPVPAVQSQAQSAGAA